MFQTLKAQNGSHQDSEYVVQSSIPASDKLKAAKKPPACTRCKMRKVRPLPIEPHLPNAGPDSYLIIASRLSTVNRDSALTRFQLKCVILAPDNCEKCLEGGVRCSYRGTAVTVENRDTSSSNGQKTRQHAFNSVHIRLCSTMGLYYYDAYTLQCVVLFHVDVAYITKINPANMILRH
jgi:hypothetical protein